MHPCARILLCAVVVAVALLPTSVLARVRGASRDSIPLANLGFDVGVVQGAQHPDAHIDGFTLHEVITHTYVHEPDQGRGTHVVQRRKLQFDDNAHLVHPRFLAGFDTLDATSTVTKDKIITLAKLNVLAYPGAKPTPDTGVSYGYDEATMADLLAAGDGLWGSTYTADMDGMQGVWDAANTELDTAKSSFAASATYSYTSAAKAKAETGVAALIFKRATQTVVAFRGSYTDGDFSNIEKWITDWIIERMGGYMKTTWTDKLGLAWGTDQQTREDEGDLTYRTTVRLGAYMSETSSSDGAQALADSANGQTVGGTSYAGTVTLSRDDADKYGYWPITKVVVEAIRSELGVGDQLLISGHSQGGGRAQLASMYLSKKYPAETKWPTVTFAAVGAACFSRDLFGTDANYLADVDPTVAHDNIVDYTHPLDPWGNALGPDVGRTCLFGTTDIVNTTPYKYCSRVWGYSGATLIFANADTTDSVKSSTMLQVKQDFKNCRYLTHLIEAMVHYIQVAGALNADGTTDGGCFTNPLIAAGDTTTCPTGKWSPDEIAAAIGLALVVIIVLAVLFFLMVLVLLFMYKGFKKCCCKSKRTVGPSGGKATVQVGGQAPQLA